MVELLQPCEKYPRMRRNSIVQLIQKQAKKARKKEEELTRHQINLFEAFMQRFSVYQGDDKVGPAVEQVELEVMAQPPQPQLGPQVGADPQP